MRAGYPADAAEVGHDPLSRRPYNIPSCEPSTRGCTSTARRRAEADRVAVTSERAGPGHNPSSARMSSMALWRSNCRPCRLRLPEQLAARGDQLVDGDLPGLLAAFIWKLEISWRPVRLHWSRGRCRGRRRQKQPERVGGRTHRHRNRPALASGDPLSPGVSLILRSPGG